METRQTFREELRTLEEQALEGLDFVAGQLDRVMEAVQHRDIEPAERLAVFNCGADTVSKPMSPSSPLK